MTQGLASSLTNLVEFRAQDMRVSQHGEVLSVPQNSGESEDLSRDITTQRAGLGIMVFSSACKVLYANQAAYHFLKALNHWENGHATDGALPDSIAGLFDQIRKSLESRVTNRDHERFEGRRLLVGEDQSVLLQGFGLPDRLGILRSRVVITMQGGIRPCDAGSSKAMALSM